jgi:hypothetical protein
MRFTKAGWTFSQTPIWAICDPRLSAPAFRLLAYLAWRQGSDNTCWPSISRMAADLHASNDTIRRHLRELEDLGYLHTTQRVGRSSVYSLTANPDGIADQYTPLRNKGGPPPPPPSELQGGTRKVKGGAPSNLRGSPRKLEGHDDKHGRETKDGENETTWPSVLEALQLALCRATFKSLLARSTATRAGDTLTVQLPDTRAVDIVQHRLAPTIERTARRIYDNPHLEIRLEPSA